MKPLDLTMLEVRALQEGANQVRVPITPGNIKMVILGQPYFSPPQAMLDQALTDVEDMRRFDGNLFSWMAKAYDYQPGDKTRWMARSIWDPAGQIYVREEWRFTPDWIPGDPDGDKPGMSEVAVDYFDEEAVLVYLPNAIVGRHQDSDGTMIGKWHPSTAMPKELSRFRYRADVRVQRLSDITEEEAVALGCLMESNGLPAEIPSWDGAGYVGWDCALDWYADLWDYVHGEGAFERNRWTFALALSRVEEVPHA